MGRTRPPLISRLFGAIFLRRELYESVAAESGAWRPAAGLVCLAAFAQEAFRMPGPFDVWLAETLGTGALLVLMLLAVLRWLVYASIVFAVARFVSGVGTPYARLLRCIGFAEAPSLLILVAYLVDPVVLPWLRLLIGFWLLAATVVAVRAALSISTSRAAVVGGLGFAFYLLLPSVAAILVS